MWKFLFDSFLLDKGTVLQLNMVGTPVNMHCFCEEYSIGEEGGDLSIPYQMKFIEYREAEVTQVSIDPTTRHAELPPQEPKRLDTRIAPSSYTVEPGDTMESIAHKIYGSSDMAASIYELNQNIVTSPVLLAPGTTLTMPV